MNRDGGSKSRGGAIVAEIAAWYWYDKWQENSNMIGNANQSSWLILTELWSTHLFTPLPLIPSFSSHTYPIIIRSSEKKVAGD